MTDFLPTLRRHVAQRTPQALEEQLEPLSHLGPALGEIFDPARQLLQGGKRLRAALCGAGWRAAGGREDGATAALVHAGAALELFQAAALVHDDIVDQADTRRGHPAAHRAVEALHRRRSWRGDATHFGFSSAVLLGDALLAASSAELARGLALLAPEDARRARQVYDVMCVEVAAGQYLDIRAEQLTWDEAEATDEAAVQAAMLVLRHKSARYSVEHPLALGAVMAGADEYLEAGLRSVGLPFGEAFQLRDDELGVFGEPELTGKPAGDDLREGKRTVLVALTLQELDARADQQARQQAQRVRTLVGDPDLTTGQVREVQDIMRTTGAAQRHEALVRERRAAGDQALSSLQISAAARDTLRDLGELLTARRY